MVRILDVYISKKFIKNLIIGFLGTVVIFFSFDFFKIIDKVTSGHLPLKDVPSLALHSIPAIISYDIMHLAALVGSLLTMYDLNVNLEIVALKTSGISFRRIMAAPLAISILLSMSLFVFTEYVSVKSFKDKKNTWAKLDGVILSKNRDNIYYRSNNTFYRIGNIDGYNNKVKRFQSVIIEGNFVEKIVNAFSGSYNPDSGEWTLHKVTISDITNGIDTFHDEYKMKINETIETFLKYQIANSESMDSDYDKIHDLGKDLSFKDIKDNISFLKSSGGNYKRLLTHVQHQRAAYPFSIIIMSIIGLSLVSQFSRSGKSKSITTGILIGFSYYVVFEIAKALGFGSIVPMIISAWIPNVLFLIIGLFFFLRAEKS